MSIVFKTKSRYIKNPTVTTGSVGVEAVRKQRNPRTFITHISVQGETFDLLAHKYFKDPERYWEIADLNPHVPFPDSIPTGTPIRIPQQ